MTNAAELHRQMWETTQAQDYQGLRRLYHQDYTYTGGDGQEHQGADAGVAVAETYLAAFPDMTFQVQGQIAEGDTSCMELVIRGTHTDDLDGIAPTGKEVEIVVCNVVETADGKILREREYFDNHSLLRQLGVLDA